MINVKLNDMVDYCPHPANESVKIFFKGCQLRIKSEPFLSNLRIKSEHLKKSVI
jgi:hypothetical protein